MLSKSTRRTAFLVWMWLCGCTSSVCAVLNYFEGDYAHVAFCAILALWARVETLAREDA
jgi:hypothetical protein